MLRNIRDAVPGLARVSESGPGQWAIRGARRRKSLRNPLAFAVYEALSPRGRVQRHRLAGSGVEVVVRHRTQDVEIFDEIMVHGTYDVPEKVRERLPVSPKILDLGGNVGLFALAMLAEFPASSVTSVEPDPVNLPILRAARSANPESDWTILPNAAGTAAGTLRMDPGGFGHTVLSGVGSHEVPVIDALQLMSEADLVKIDIEGSEWPILHDARLPETDAVITMEWHHSEQYPGNAHAQAVSLLERAGYSVTGEDTQAPVGMVWAWKD